MNTLLLSPQSTLSDRILDTFPSGAYALSGLLRLMDIVETTSVPTAAVECRLQPRLLINPQFVARHAQTPEKLLMLVMHELHHVLLGHTTLFPRLTPEQNFVFDAVINGIVCRMFPRAEYTAFFSDYYQAGSFPQCLLRPPPLWPEKTASQALSSQVPEGMQPEQWKHICEVHQALYSDTGASYKEVFDLLPCMLKGQVLGDIPLIGGHEEGDPAGQLEQKSPVLFEIVRELVEQWPQPPDPIKGRSLADVLQSINVNAKKVPSNRAILRKLICKVAATQGYGHIPRRELQGFETLTPIPVLSRRSAVQHALGSPTLLYPGVVPWVRRRFSGQRVHVYIDVSGSMSGILRPLYGAVLDCEDLVFPSVHLFSTQVTNITPKQLRAGVCKSTGGTDIACVAGHMAAHKVRRALLITDGWVGQPRGSHLKTLSEARLAVAYLGENTNHGDLQAVTNHSAQLTLGDSL